MTAQQDGPDGPDDIELTDDDIEQGIDGAMLAQYTTFAITLVGAAGTLIEGGESQLMQVLFTEAEVDRVIADLELPPLDFLASTGVVQCLRVLGEWLVPLPEVMLLLTSRCDPVVTRMSRAVIARLSA